MAKKKGDLSTDQVGAPLRINATRKEFEKRRDRNRASTSALPGYRQSTFHLLPAGVPGLGSFLRLGDTLAHGPSSNTLMAVQTVTRATESDCEPGVLYNVLADVTNIPGWAPAFADGIDRITDTRYRVTKNSETFSIEICLQPAAGVVDYIREMPNGKRDGAYIRVTPRPLGGSTITMTVPVGPNTMESAVANTLEQELASTIRLASS